jgi:outer membrane protein assembly factor BamB
VSLDKITPILEAQINDEINKPTVVADLFLHQWPQQGLNCQHIGRSLFSTADNPGIEKWRFPASDYCDQSPVIDTNGVIYFQGSYLYAIYSNGTLKWEYPALNVIENYGAHPAIGEDGTVYTSTFGGYLHAINPNGTRKWYCSTTEIQTSITLGNDGVLYYGHQQGLDARYPNGTLKWTFHTSNDVQSTPAIDDQGIIYFGSHDFNIYAVYPDGIMKWNYTTEGWVHGSPTIGSDGTIYCGSDDYYLYAFYPNGTLRWKTYLDSGMRSSPSQDKQGNLYFGLWHSKIMSVAPNGTIRWIFLLPQTDRVWGSTTAISDDGTIYIGNCINMDWNGGGEIIALDLDGNMKWRKILSDVSLHSSPVIASDGTVYICASDSGSPEAWGYLHAFGNINNNQPPETPTIEGPTQGDVRTPVQYIFKANDDDGTPFFYFIDWGDGTTFQTVDYEPGRSYSLYHTWKFRGTYIIRAKAIDTFGLESDWATLTVKMPLSYEPPHFQFFEWLFERFPNAFPLLRLLLRY